MLFSWRGLRPYGGWVLVLSLAAIAAVVAFRPAGAQDAQEVSQSEIAFAEASYAGVCAECHGGDGRGAIVPGTDRMAPALVGRESVTAAYMDLVLRTGRMPPAGDPFDNRAREVFYSDEERQAMVEFMTERFDLERDIPVVEEGDVAVGLEAFALNCAHCHGNAGGGGTAGENAWTPRVNNVEPVAIAEAIRVGPFEMPAFSEDVLSEDEVNGVASYMEAVAEERGTPVLGLVELNPVFASGFVALLAFGLLGSLLYIGGRPVTLDVRAFDTGEEVEIPGGIKRPSGMTPMPGDPAYETAVEEAVPEEKGVPYLDEVTRPVTTGEDERAAAPERDLDHFETPPGDHDADEGTG